MATRRFATSRFGPALVALACLVLVNSCARPRHGAQTQNPSPATNPEPQQLSPRRAVQMRDAIDRAGSRADCTDFEHATGQQAWLGAWCGWRSQDWTLIQSLAPAAISFFESTADTRRQIEILLLHAIARTEFDLPGGQQLADRAYHMWRWSKMPIHGPRTDPFAGDFPYLVAEAVERGLEPPPDHADRRPTRPMLLDIADFEYASLERMNALPHVDRTRIRWALELGELQVAIAHLIEAFALDRASENLAGLDENFALFARFARLAGLEDAAFAVQGWVQFEPLVLGSDEEARQTSRFDVAPKLRTRSGRAALTNTIRELRRNASSAIRPPRELVEGLRAVRNMEVIKGDSWKLAYQAGELLKEQGYRGDARRYLRRGVELVEQMRGSLATPALRQQFFADKRPLYLALVDLYVGIDTPNLAQEDYEEALALANQLKARGLLDLLVGDIEASRATERQATVWRAHASPLATSDMVLENLQKWTAPEQPANRLHRSARLRSIPAQLGPNTAVVEYLLAPRRSYVWVITDQGIEMRRLAGREDIEPRVEEFVALTAEPGLSRAQKKRLHGLAERLYVELIGPIEDVVVDRNRLIIAPDRLLYQLSFEALGIPMRRAAPKWLVEDYTLSYVPSSRVLALLRSRERASTQGNRALVLSDPDLDRQATGLLPYAPNLPADGAFNLEDAFPPLVSTSAEVRAVRRAGRQVGFESVDVYRGREATEHRFTSAELRTYRWLHIASHGISDAESLRSANRTRVRFQQPALLLSIDRESPQDGLLTLAELLALETSAELAVLSGCSTGRGWRALGEGAFGLAGALLYTGTSTVIASTWDVGDRATAELMTRVYAELGQDKRPEEALRAAQIAMLKRSGTEAPFFWAAFRTVGY
ncbi:MAG: CHAT domain-containing protein [Myxococcota bacterium]